MMNNIYKMVQPHLSKALLGGFIGTILFSIMGKYLAPHIIGQPMDIAAILAHMMGGSYTLGVMAHFMIGTVVFPIAYLILGLNNLRGSGALRGAIFLFFIYLVAMIVVMPMMGLGMFFDSLPKAMVALMGHLVFGLTMGAIIGKPNKSSS